MKKFLLTLMACLAISFALPPAARALTAAGLDGLYYGAYMVGMADANCELPRDQFAGKFELRGSQLYMTNFWRGFDMPVTIQDDAIVLTTHKAIPDNGNGLYSGGTIKCEPATVYKLTNPYAAASGSGCYQGVFYGYSALDSRYAVTLKNKAPGSSTEGNSDRQTEDNIYADCKYRFVTDSYLVMTMNYGGDKYFCGDGLRVYVFDTNSKATEYVDNEISDTYMVDVEIDPLYPNSAVIKNVAAYGINFKNNIVNGKVSTTLVWVDADLDYEEETVIMPAQYLGGDTLNGVDYYGDPVYSGKGNLYSGSYYNRTRYNAVWYAEAYYYPVLEDISIGNPNDSDIIGRITSRESEHRNVEENHWHKAHGGKLETWHKMNFEFDNMTLWSQFTGQNATIIGSVDKTVYETPYDYEYTHDAKLSLSWFAQNDTQFGFGGAVSGRVKSRYIDSYDLYVMPGTYTSIDELTTHHDTGIEGAELLYSGIKNVSRSADEENAAFTIPDMLVKRPASISFEPNRNYTLFLKANYNNGLHPTYHAMTIAGDIPTGVGTIMEDGPMMIVRPVGGGVEVSGYEGMVEVYSVAGTCVFSGVADGLIELPQGTYIVRAAQRSWKVNVN